jgi:hypothetical protein
MRETSAPALDSLNRPLAADLRAGLTDAATVEMMSFERDRALAIRADEGARVDDFHITSRAAWESALGAGIYDSRFVEVRGFHPLLEGRL